MEGGKEYRYYTVWKEEGSEGGREGGRERGGGEGWSEGVRKVVREGGREGGEGGSASEGRRLKHSLKQLYCSGTSLHVSFPSQVISSDLPTDCPASLVSS